jgi:hypothetical protein
MVPGPVGRRRRAPERFLRDFWNRARQSPGDAGERLEETALLAYRPPTNADERRYFELVK